MIKKLLKRNTVSEKERVELTEEKKMELRKRCEEAEKILFGDDELRNFSDSMPSIFDDDFFACNNRMIFDDRMFTRLEQQNDIYFTKMDELNEKRENDPNYSKIYDKLREKYTNDKLVMDYIDTSQEYYIDYYKLEANIEAFALDEKSRCFVEGKLNDIHRGFMI